MNIIEEFHKHCSDYLSAPSTLYHWKDHKAEENWNAALICASYALIIPPAIALVTCLASTFASFVGRLIIKKEPLDEIDKKTQQVSQRFLSSKEQDLQSLIRAIHKKNRPELTDKQCIALLSQEEILEILQWTPLNQKAIALISEKQLKNIDMGKVSLEAIDLLFYSPYLTFRGQKEKFSLLSQEQVNQILEKPIPENLALLRCLDLLSDAHIKNIPAEKLKLEHIGILFLPDIGHLIHDNIATLLKHIGLLSESQVMTILKNHPASAIGMTALFSLDRTKNLLEDLETACIIGPFIPPEHLIQIPKDTIKEHLFLLFPSNNDAMTTLSKDRIAQLPLPNIKNILQSLEGKKKGHFISLLSDDQKIALRIPLPIKTQAPPKSEATGKDLLSEKAIAIKKAIKDFIQKNPPFNRKKLEEHIRKDARFVRLDFPIIFITKHLEKHLLQKVLSDDLIDRCLLSASLQFCLVKGDFASANEFAKQAGFENYYQFLLKDKEKSISPADETLMRESIENIAPTWTNRYESIQSEAIFSQVVNDHLTHLENQNLKVFLQEGFKLLKDERTQFNKNI
jgi:hypothetical protein